MQLFRDALGRLAGDKELSTARESTTKRTRNPLKKIGAEYGTSLRCVVVHKIPGEMRSRPQLRFPDSKRILVVCLHACFLATDQAIGPVRSRKSGQLPSKTLRGLQLPKLGQVEVGVVLLRQILLRGPQVPLDDLVPRSGASEDKIPQRRRIQTILLHRILPALSCTLCSAIPLEYSHAACYQKCPKHPSYPHAGPMDSAKWTGASAPSKRKT